MSRQLLKSRSFAPLFWCQAFAAFCDSYLKTAMLLVVLIVMPKQAAWLNQVAAALFMAPSFVLSALGGQWADRYDKGMIARRLKLAEFAAVILAAVGFVLGSLPLLFVALFCFGVIVALFSPVKYGIIPELVATRDVATANAFVEGATFVAVIAGALLGTLISREGNGPVVFCAVLMGSSAACYGACLFIPRNGGADPDLAIEANVLRSTGRLLGDLWRETRLWRGGIIVSMFWLVGSVTMTLLPVLVKQTLGGSAAVINIYFALFAAGIALGSALASWLLDGRTLLLPVPVAAALLGLVSLDLGICLWGLPGPGLELGPAAFFRTGLAWHVGADLCGLAICGGLFVVPAFAAVQIWAEPGRRARIVAAVNILNAIFMVAGALVVALLQMAGMSLAGLFLLIGVAAFGAAIWIFAVLPVNPVRDLAALVFRVVYRLDVRGAGNVAKAGPNAIIVMNHVSFLDAAVLFSVLETEAIFAIDTFVARQWWVKPFLRYVKALPIDPTSPLTTRTLIQTARSGKTLVIFPEGRLTRTGSLMKIYDGAGLIAARTGLPVVPVHIKGTEPTRFSYLSGSQARRRWFNKITLTILDPQIPAFAPELKGRALRQAAALVLTNIMTGAVFAAASIDRTLFEAVVGAAREHGENRVALEDPQGKMTYKRLLTASRIIGGKLGPLTAPGGTIGVMLPSANAAAVTILGLMSAGRVPAMVNFTAGATAIKSAGHVAGFDTIVTSRTFIAKANYAALAAELATCFALVYLEDLASAVTLFDKVGALLRRHRPLVTRAPADPAAILFTSGSEGVPKGVALSHRNMLANAAQAKAVIDFGREDRLFNVLPVFHAFGLTIGLVIPLVHGIPVYLYPTPLHYRIIPELMYMWNATILFGTDTFLTGYARVANSYDFRALRYVFAGAEPLRPATRVTWMEKFGLRLLEGYGVTEAAPVLAINTPMFHQPGSVGRLLPGIEARLETVDGVAEGGRLFVRGPNVMLGYLTEDEPGVIQPLQEGWHDTGDVVTMSTPGFISIKGRAKRFAKIAGEMVSLAAVEALAGELWPEALSAAIVMPDPRRGERIVLVTQKPAATRADFAGACAGAQCRGFDGARRRHRLSRHSIARQRQDRFSGRETICRGARHAGKFGGVSSRHWEPPAVIAETIHNCGGATQSTSRSGETMDRLASLATPHRTSRASERRG